MSVIFLLLATLGQCIAQPKSIFLLAGQSNMSGRGGVVNRTWDGIVPPECAPNSSIFRFTANETWEQARDPLHIGIDRHMPCGVGPGMPFANSLLQPNSSFESIGLVPCAIGGSPLDSWEKITNDHYPVLIERALASTRNGGVLRGLLWYQGETDAAFNDTAMTYGKRFENFLKDVRADLSSVSPNLPVILVALASEDGYGKTVRDAQLGLKMPNVKCVDALGLRLSDRMHLTTEAQVILGGLMAQAFMRL